MPGKKGSVRIEELVIVVGCPDFEDVVVTTFELVVFPVIVVDSIELQAVSNTKQTTRKTILMGLLLKYFFIIDSKTSY
jgi:hypothetical protein